MNWGKGIFLFYSLFVVALLGVVYFSFTQDVNLVADDYYQQEIDYENQINRMRNTSALAQKPALELAGDFVKLTFPPNSSPSGYILFFHPAQASQDRKVAIALDSHHTQQIDFSSQKPGKWIAKLFWKDKDKEYYQEFILLK